MKEIKRYILFVLVAAGGWAGCKKPNYAAEQQATSTLRNVGDYIKNNFDFTIFSAAMEKTGLLDTLNDPNQQFTVFVPDNAAFQADSILSVADLDRFSIDSLRYIVRSYIIRQKLFSSDIPLSMDNLYVNLNGINLYVSAKNNGVFSCEVSGAPMESIQTATGTGVVYDVPLANGVIHILSRVMKYYSGTVQEYIGSRPDLSYFVTGLKRFGLWDSLAVASPYTILAPINNAFDTNGIHLDSIQALNVSAYQPVLFSAYTLYPHHIFLQDLGMVYYNSGVPVDGGDVLFFSLYGPAGVYLKTAAGMPLGPLAQMSTAGGRVSPYVNSNSTDYICSNGIVHLIANLIILPSDAKR